MARTTTRSISRFCNLISGLEVESVRSKNDVCYRVGKRQRRVKLKGPAVIVIGGLCVAVSAINVADAPSSRLMAPSGVTSRYSSRRVAIKPGKTVNIKAVCPYAEDVTGGGYELEDERGLVVVSAPSAVGGVEGEWLVSVRNPTSRPIHSRAFVMCIKQ